MLVAFAPHADSKERPLRPVVEALAPLDYSSLNYWLSEEAMTLIATTQMVSNNGKTFRVK